MSSQIFEAAQIPNQKQSEAIQANKGNYVILAGPGTGKTFTIEKRIRNLIETHNVSPNQICALTFSNYDKNNLQSKLSGTKVHARTFHALAAMIIGRNNYKFTICSEEQATKIINSVEKAYTYEQITEKKRLGIRIPCNYNNYLKEHKMMDFEDLIISCSCILRKIGPKSCKYKYVLVDESHDMNPAEFQMVKLLSKNIFIVIDPNQSMYAWRGSDENILSKILNDLDSVKTIELNIDYRHTQSILDAAQCLAQWNFNLRSNRANVPGETKPKLYILKNLLSQLP